MMTQITSSRKKFLFLSASLLIVGLVWISFSVLPPGQTTLTTGIPYPQTGFIAPDFVLKDKDGTDIQLSNLRGQPVVINLWASWCVPCRTEMPAMQSVYEEYQDQGLVILAVNATNQDRKSSAIDFANELQLTFPILFDEDGYVSQLYRLDFLPTTFFVLPDGTINDVIIGGPMAEALLRIRIQKLFERDP